MHRGSMVALTAWGKWAESWAAHDSSVGLPSRSSLCAPKAGREVLGGMASALPCCVPVEPS